MNAQPLTRIAMAAVLLFCGKIAAFGGETYVVPLENPTFSAGANDNGVPAGWVRYGSGGSGHELKLIPEAEGEASLLIFDGDPSSEIGVSQAFELRGGETYQATALVRGVEGGSTFGAYLQLRFLHSNKLVQKGLPARSTEDLTEISVKGTAPADTTRGVIYLYTHRAPTPQVVISEVRLIGGLPAPPPPPPEPIPPQYEKLKDLHREISLTQDSRPNAAIVAPADGAYQAAAKIIQQAIENRGGVQIPILSDESPEASLPPSRHLIVLGNRSTNRTINTLYNRYYCLVDLKYPGPQGYVIRTVHNPLGNGRSVVVVGGNDATGARKGADALADILNEAPLQHGNLALGWTMETQLGKDVVPPTDIKRFETWEASRGYGSIGYFGWCSISKHMAMYYMTGNEASAREVVRLSFPDDEAIRDIEAIDGERIENKHDPLAGFYHYNAHMAILFWDLIEESPVFTDEERLAITNAFARQLNHRKGEGVYGLTKPRSSVGSRHGQWAAISLYCLGRYFNKSYPDPIWAQCERAGRLAFASLHEHAWVAGESDNLFWYNTGTAPVLTYMTLTGDRKPLANGVLTELLQGQEALISGRERDWALNSASIGMLNKAAYLTGDGRWIVYRDRTGVDTSIFRLGQSFWPDESIAPQPPEDLVGRWTIHRLPEPAWGARGSGLPQDRSFYFGSYRSATDGSGDFVLLDGFNGASRNPYHTFDVLQLRLAGNTILDGYHNQVLTSADGMVEPAVAMDATLRRADVIGSTAIAVGEVPDAAFCNWRRTLAQRTGCYALILDDLTFRTDSRNMAVATTWQVPGGRYDQETQAVRTRAAELRSCDAQETEAHAGVVTMNWHGAVAEGSHRYVFTLVGLTAPDSANSLACLRVSDNAAALRLPQPALAVTGEYSETQADLAVVATDHLHAQALIRAGLDNELVSSNVPIDIDWDFVSGTAHVVAIRPTILRMNLANASTLQVDGQSIPSKASDRGSFVALSAGRHTIQNAVPAKKVLAQLTASLQRLLAEGEALRKRQIAALDQIDELSTAAADTAFTYQVGEEVADMVCIDSPNQSLIAVASGNTIHLLRDGGELLRKMETEGKIRVLHWWPEPEFLLAGCVDERVIAFGLEGQKEWTFISEMDQAVYEAAKTYWFKSAPGHEGIHGLYTGVFDAGENRCFVGSACTLEILDQTGDLVKRTPVFWGPGRKFLLLPGAEGGQNLLISRWPNGYDSLAVVDSRSLAVSGRGYQTVPEGHTYVSGWTAQNRTGLFCEDLDGDGKREVATAVNGTWNRVTVYSQAGKPLHNAQLGPGPSKTPRSRLSDMDVADLDGDGNKEILIGLTEGLVLCLNRACEKVWSTRLPSPPLSLHSLGRLGGTRVQTIVGCVDGTVVSLDSDGNACRIGRVSGRPTRMVSIDVPMAVLATDKGEVKGFLLGR